MTINREKLREKSRDAIAESLGDAYDCMRAWSAWGVGTMGSDDFCLVADDESRLEEITEAALSPALAAIDTQTAEIERLREAIADYLEAQDAVDNNEYQSMPEDFGRLNGRRKAARDDLDAALLIDPNANEGAYGTT